MDREGSGFSLHQEKFLRTSMEQIKAGKFDNPQIKELMKDQMFEEALTEIELSAL